MTRITGSLHEDICTCMTISLCILLQSCGDNIYFVFDDLCFENRVVYEIMWKNTAGPDRLRVTISYRACALHYDIIQGVRFACWITKVTDAHLECVILIAFPRQHRLRERTSLFLYSYIAGLVNLDSRSWWLVNFSSGPFTLGKIAPNDDRAGGWVAEAIWRTEKRRTYFNWKSNHEFLVVHLVLQSLLSRFKLFLLLNTFAGVS